MKLRSPQRGFVWQPRVAVLGYPGKRTRWVAQPQWGRGPERADGGKEIDSVSSPPVASSHNPVGVVQGARPLPRVAEYGNPGLSDENPFGFKNRQTQVPSYGGAEEMAKLQTLLKPGENERRLKDKKPSRYPCIVMPIFLFTCPSIFPLRLPKTVEHVGCGLRLYREEARDNLSKLLRA